MLSEPGSVYIGQVNQNSAFSADITQNIINFFILKRITPSELVVVGSDGKMSTLVRKMAQSEGLKPLFTINYIGLYAYCILMKCLFAAIFRKLTERHLGHKFFSE